MFQKALIRSWGSTVQIDTSESRFLALYEELLDNAIHPEGWRMTVTGVAQGDMVGSLGETEYRYLYLLIKEVHVWKEEKLRPHQPYPQGPWWHNPWYLWHP